MKVSELAHAAPVSRDTVRHYTRLGLISADKDDANGYHRYTHSALTRIQFIKRAQGLGFTLQDIQRMFSCIDENDNPCPQVSNLIQARLNECAEKLLDLTAFFNHLQQALDDWQDLPDHVPTGRSIRNLIESDAGETHEVSYDEA